MTHSSGHTVVPVGHPAGPATSEQKTEMSEAGDVELRGDLSARACLA
jgi:hypothetical protein